MTETVSERVVSKSPPRYKYSYKKENPIKREVYPPATSIKTPY